MMFDGGNRLYAHKMLYPKEVKDLQSYILHWI